MLASAQGALATPQSTLLVHPVPGKHLITLFNGDYFQRLSKYFESLKQLFKLHFQSGQDFSYELLGA